MESVEQQIANSAAITAAANTTVTKTNLDLNDINMMMNIVSKGFNNGLFSAEEAVHVVELYKKLKKILS